MADDPPKPPDELLERMRDPGHFKKRREAMRRLDRALAALARQEGKKITENSWPLNW